MTRPLRIFHLIKSLGRGGAEMLLPETLRHADRERFEFDYGYFLPWKDAMVRALESQGVEVLCFSARNNASILLSANRVARHLRESGADVLHCHLPVAGVVGRLAGRLAGVPVVYSEHNLQERYHPLTRRLNRSTWGWQERVVAVSGDVAESIRNHIGSPVPVEVVLNGVDVDRFDRAGVDGAALRKTLGIPASAPVIGTVAVFREQKRLHDWLEAASALLSEHPDVHFLVVGDGPLRDELHDRASSLGLGKSVHWPGLLEDVRPCLAAMDIYLMSSMFEGMPIALLEAMSMKCAVVATAVGGIPELVRNGDNGFLVEPGRPELLVQTVCPLLDHREDLKKYGAAARRTVLEGFSIRRLSSQLEAIYLQVQAGFGNGR